MKKTNSDLPSWGRRFLWISALVLVTIFVALGWHTVSTVRQNRSDSAERHQARMDPKAAEAGRTAAETELPAGAHPRQVKVGMYLDGIASISLLDLGMEPGLLHLVPLDRRRHQPR